MTVQNAKLIKYLIAAIILALPSYLIRFSVFGIPTTALELAIYLLFIFYFLFFISKKIRWHLPEKKWLWAIGLFVLGAIIGVIVSPDKRVALGQFKGFVFDPILFVFVIYSAIKEGLIERSLIASSLTAAGLLTALSAALPYVDASGRRLGIYGLEAMASANYLALFLAPMVVLTAGEPKKTVFHRLSILFMLLAIFATASRGALFGLILGLWWLWSTGLSRVARYLIPIGIVGAMVILAKPDLSAAPDSGRVASSNNVRYEIWKTTAEMLTEKTRNFLFGVGLGNYQQYFTDLTKTRINYPEFIAPKALTPHNLLLAWWVNGGVLMLAGGIWLLILTLRKTGFLPAQAALVTLVGHGLVDTAYFKNDLSALFWLLIVLALCAPNKEASAKN